jgi:hypothetical protein
MGRKRSKRKVFSVCVGGKQDEFSTEVKEQGKGEEGRGMKKRAGEV